MATRITTATVTSNSYSSHLLNMYSKLPCNIEGVMVCLSVFHMQCHNRQQHWQLVFLLHNPDLKLAAYTPGWVKTAQLATACARPLDMLDGGDAMPCYVSALGF